MKFGNPLSIITLLFFFPTPITWCQEAIHPHSRAGRIEHWKKDKATLELVEYWKKSGLTIKWRNRESDLLNDETLYEGEAGKGSRTIIYFGTFANDRLVDDGIRFDADDHPIASRKPKVAEECKASAPPPLKISEPIVQIAKVIQEKKVAPVKSKPSLPKPPTHPKFDIDEGGGFSHSTCRGLNTVKLHGRAANSMQVSGGQRLGKVPADVIRFAKYLKANPKLTAVIQLNIQPLYFSDGTRADNFDKLNPKLPLLDQAINLSVRHPKDPEKPNPNCIVTIRYLMEEQMRIEKDLLIAAGVPLNQIEFKFGSKKSTKYEIFFKNKQ